MREKYIDEAVGLYFIYGEYPDGTVDISNGRDDVFKAIPRDLAEMIVSSQATFREELYYILKEF